MPRPSDFGEGNPDPLDRRLTADADQAAATGIEESRNSRLFISSPSMATKAVTFDGRKRACMGPPIRQFGGKNDLAPHEGGAKSLKALASPTGFEPVLPP